MELEVRASLSGSFQTVIVAEDATLFDLRCAIESSFGLEIQLQVLFSESRNGVLEGKSSLAELGLASGDVILLTRSHETWLWADSRGKVQESKSHVQVDELAQLVSGIARDPPYVSGTVKHGIIKIFVDPFPSTPHEVLQFLRAEDGSQAHRAVIGQGLKFTHPSAIRTKWKEADGTLLGSAWAPAWKHGSYSLLEEKKERERSNQEWIKEENEEDLRKKAPWWDFDDLVMVGSDHAEKCSLAEGQTYPEQAAVALPALTCHDGDDLMATVSKCTFFTHGALFEKGEEGKARHYAVDRNWYGTPVIEVHPVLIVCTNPEKRTLSFVYTWSGCDAPEPPHPLAFQRAQYRQMVKGQSGMSKSQKKIARKKKREQYT